MSFEDQDLAPQQDELASLKARADLMGVKYHPSISADKLREKVNAALAPAKDDAPEATNVAPVATTPAVETDGQRRARRRKEASALVRIRVTCMNPAKSEWEGEIFTVANATVGTFKKFVPFNAPDGWHVPHIIYQQMVERQCQVFTTTRDAKGRSTRKGKLIKEFAIEVLPQLTAEELAELALVQARSKSVE